MCAFNRSRLTTFSQPPVTNSRMLFFGRETNIRVIGQTRQTDTDTHCYGAPQSSQERISARVSQPVVLKSACFPEMRNYFADISGSRRPETTLHSGTLGLVKRGERVRLVLLIEEWNSLTSFQEEDSSGTPAAQLAYNRSQSIIRDLPTPRGNL
jgi:hypothetical protein